MTPKYQHIVECDKVVIYPQADEWNLDTHWIAADSEDALRVEEMR